MPRLLPALLLSCALAPACADDADGPATTDTSETPTDVTVSQDSMSQDTESQDSVAMDTTAPDTSSPDAGPFALAGADGDPAIAALPEVAIPEPDAGAVVDAGAVMLVRDRVVLALADAATVDDVNALARTLDATLVGTSRELGLLVLAPATPTSDLSWVGDALEVADASDAIDIAAPSVIEGAHLVAPAHALPSQWDLADDGGWDWGLQHVRAPAAWNLQRHLAAQAAPRVVVIDVGFNPHADVTLDADTPLTAGTIQHGTQVAGVIAAHFDAVGIEGVVPVATTVVGRSGKIFPFPAENVLAQLVTEIGRARAAGVPLVVNMSLGHNLYRIEERDDGTLVLAYEHTIDELVPSLGMSFQEIARRTGRLMRRISRHAATDRWLFLCSAGNSNVNEARRAEAAGAGVTLRLADTFARDVSGCGSAAAEGDQHFMSVEALAPGGERLAHFSSRGGTIAAPGEGLGLLTGTGYAAGNGTSFSSPMVAGAAALLWRYHPSASFGDVRAALIGSARPGAGGSAPRLDLFAALRFLEGLGGPDLDALLADVDDGTIDGSLRTLPPDGVSAPIVAPGMRGDGCVDMADFRAFRDARLDAAVEGGNAAFDPASTHRDQNGDGVVRLTLGLVEGRHSRFDLDGDGVVGDADLGLLAGVFGTCRDGVAGPAITEGHAASDLPALMSTVDLFLRLPEGAGDVTVVAPGRARVTVSAADVAARAIADHLLLTLPMSACDGALSLRTERGGAIRTYTTPASAPLWPGRDYVLDGAVLGAVDRLTPLVHTHTGPHVYEAVAYAGDGQVLATADLEPPFLAAPTYLDDALVQHTRFAAMRTGGWVDVATDGVARAHKIAGTSTDLVPWAWAEDGQGLLLRTGFGDARLFWLAPDRQASAEVAPDVGVSSDAWPTVVDGFVYLFGNDGRLYRAATRARDDDWLSAVAGTGTCEATLELPAPEVVIDLTTHAAARDLRLPRGYPGAMPESADRLAFVVASGGGEDLWLTSLGDEPRAVELVSGWEARGGFDTFNLDASDGVAWSPDGRLLVYNEAAGVRLVDLGAGDLPEPATLNRVLVHDAPAVVAFDPTGQSLVAVTTEGPISARVARVHVYRAPWGGAAAGIYVHEHRHGGIGISRTGSQIAIVEKDGSAGNVVVYAAPSTTPLSSTATWKDPCGTASCTNTSEIMPAWARDVLPW